MIFKKRSCKLLKTPPAPLPFLGRRGVVVYQSGGLQTEYSYSKQSSPGFTWPGVWVQILFKGFHTVKNKNKQTKTLQFANFLLSSSFFFSPTHCPWHYTRSFHFRHLTATQSKWKIGDGRRERVEERVAVKLMWNVTILSKLHLHRPWNAWVDLVVWLYINLFSRATCKYQCHLHTCQAPLTHVLFVSAYQQSGDSDSEDTRVSGKPGRALFLSVFTYPLLLWEYHIFINYFLSKTKENRIPLMQ